MAKPYDSATKKLLEFDPPAWLACAGLDPTGPVRVIDSEVSTVTAEADKVFEVGDPPAYLAHFELQSGHDLALPRRLLHYNVLLHHRHELPVRSVAVILRRAAESPGLTGTHHVRFVDGASYLDFRYSVLRVWTLDLETVLRGGLGMLPLAPLAGVSEADLPSVINRMKRRLDREVPQAEANLLWTATKVLMGLVFPVDLTLQLLQGVQDMRESVTYQAMLEEGRVEGRVEGERRILLRVGRNRFGAPSSNVVAALDAITDEATLAALADRLLEVGSWDELLAFGGKGDHHP